MNNNYHASTWFVTGSTGLVGSTVIEKLRDIDLAVIALTRKGSPKEIVNWLIDLGVKVIEGDLLIPESYENHLSVCDIVVHTAATVLNSDPAENYSVNYVGTKNLLKTMNKFGINRLIHISSAGVYGKPQNDPITENRFLEPVGPYSKSKLKAEELILESFKDISITIIRPPYIFGDRDRNLVPTLINSFSRRIMPRIWRSKPELGFVHALDVASLVLLAGSQENTPSIIYNIESLRITYSELLNMLDRSTSKRIFQLPIPYFMVYFFAWITDVAIRITNKRKIYARKRSRIMKKSWIFATDKAKDQLGWSPIHTEANELEMLLTNYYNKINGISEDIDIRDNI